MGEAWNEASLSLNCSHACCSSLLLELVCICRMKLSLIPRPLQDFILQLQHGEPEFSPQLQDKIWEWPGKKAIWGWLKLASFQWLSLWNMQGREPGTRPIREQWCYENRTITRCKHLVQVYRYKHKYQPLKIGDWWLHNSVFTWDAKYYLVMYRVKTDLTIKRLQHG